MAITVGHDPAIAIQGYMATDAGRNKGRSERAQFIAQQQQAAQEFGLRQKQMRQQQSQFDEEMRFRQAEAQAGRQHDVQMRNQMSELGRQDAEFDEKLKQNLIKYEYSAKQQAEFQKIAEAIEQVDKSEDYRPEEKMELRRQLQAQMLGIKKLPTLQQQGMYPEGQEPGKTYQIGSQMVSRRADGKEDVRFEITPKDVTGFTKQAIEVAKVISYKDENDKVGKQSTDWNLFYGSLTGSLKLTAAGGGLDYEKTRYDDIVMEMIPKAERDKVRKEFGLDGTETIISELPDTEVTTPAQVQIIADSAGVTPGEVLQAYARRKGKYGTSR